MSRKSFNAAMLLSTGLIAVAGCASDGPVQVKPFHKFQSALLSAPSVVERAENGTLDRGEQDFLVRFERTLPGFGGLYIKDGIVNVYMKPTGVPDATVRQVLAAAYAIHANPLVRQALSNVVAAVIHPAAYSLSELIAIQERIDSVPVLMPGWQGMGVSIRSNRVHVTFADNASLTQGLQVIESIGVPTAALSAEIGGPNVLASGWSDHHRPTFAGIYIGVANETRSPGAWCFVGTKFVTWCYLSQPGSLGFNIRTATGTEYFMTASHVVNELSGENGAVGDTVFQPLGRPYTLCGNVRCVNDPIGTITVNPRWDVNCPFNHNTGLPYDYCTSADVALGTYFPGETHVRAIGISVTGGVNGNRGSDPINNYYNLIGVLSPEYVNDTLHHDGGKSGASTGTTSGPIVEEMAERDFLICFPAFPCVVPTVWLHETGLTVVQAAWGSGDSGGAAFTNVTNGPYAAMGIVVAGEGSAASVCTGATCKFFFSRWDQIEPRLGLGRLHPETIFSP